MDLHAWLVLIASSLGAVETIALSLVFLFKPLRNLVVNLFNKTIREPNEKNEEQIKRIIKKQKDNENQLVEINEYVKDRKDSADRVDLAILHHLIFDTARGYLRRGKITLTELDDLKNLMEVYEGLGGNGTAKAAYEQCQKLLKESQHED